MDEEIDYFGIIFDKNAPEGERRDAVIKLSSSKSPDDRVIAIHSLLNFPVLTFEELNIILDKENDAEVKSEIYVALAIANRERSLKILEKEEKLISTDREKMYFSVAMALITSSRKYLLDVMRYLYSDDSAMRMLSVKFIRMLISEDDDISNAFMDLLIEDADSMAELR